MTATEHVAPAGSGQARLYADERRRREDQTIAELGLDGEAALLLPLIVSLAKLAAQRSDSTAAPHATGRE